MESEKLSGSEHVPCEDNNLLLQGGITFQKSVVDELAPNAIGLFEAVD